MLGYSDSQTWMADGRRHRTGRVVTMATVMMVSLAGWATIGLPTAGAVPPFPIYDYPPALNGQGTLADPSLLGAVDDKWVYAANPSAEDIVDRYTADGWIRLTTNDTIYTNARHSNQASNILNDIPFSSRTGFTVAFDYRQAGGHIWSGGNQSNTGDGISMYLINGENSVSAGGSGVGLGYAANIDGSNLSTFCGVEGGYLGLGLDVFGNYAIDDKGNYGGDKSLADTGNFVGLRGSAPQSGCRLTSGNNGFPENQTGAQVTSDQYRWITGTRLSSVKQANGTHPFPLAANQNHGIQDVGDIWTGNDGSTNDPALLPSSLYRRVWIDVIPSATAVKVTVYMSALTVKTARPDKRFEIMSYDLSQLGHDQIPMPKTLKLGFSASTGSATDYHDIRHITVQDIGDASIVKTVSGGTSVGGVQTFKPGDDISFTLAAANLGPSPIGQDKTATAANPANNAGDLAVIKDDLSALPISFDAAAVRCTATGGANCRATSFTGGVLTQEWTSPPTTGDRPLVTVTVSGKITSTARAGTYTNRAIIPNIFPGETLDQAAVDSSLQRDGGYHDCDLSNNESTVQFQVINPPRFTLQKTSSDETTPDPTGLVHPGDLLSYTVTAINVPSVAGDPLTAGDIPNLILTDDLTHVLDSAGFVAGSARLTIGDAGAIAEADPQAGILTTAPFTLPANTTAVLTYQVRVKTGAWLSRIDNTVSGTGGQDSSIKPDCVDACMTSNHTNARVFLDKVDSAGRKLPGSEFVILDDDNGQAGPLDAGLTVEPLVVAKAGVSSVVGGGFEIDSIAPGTYWLKETKSPSAYSLLAQPVGFTVRSDGSVTPFGSEATAVMTVVGSTMKVGNVAMLSGLPATGGTGWTALPWLGLGTVLTLAGAGAALWLRRRRVEARD